MHSAAALSLAFVFLAAPAELTTQYKVGLGLRVEAESSFSMETTAFEMIRNGEAIDRPVEGEATTEWRRTVERTEVLEVTGTAPSRVRHEWLEAEAGAEEGSDDRPDGELEGLIVEIATDADGEVDVTVIEGSEPEEALLAGLATTLRFDVLLPTEEATEWELGNDAIRHALGFDREAGLFGAPERGERPERRRDFAQDLKQERRRGGGGRGRGDSGARMFRDAEWEGQAKRAAETVEFEGHECIVIELEIEASGELPERGRGGFGGGRRRGEMSRLAAPAAPRENTFEIELEGRLLFATDLGRPVLLELEGTTGSERHMSRESERGSMEVNTTRAGTFVHRAVVTEVEAE